MAAGVQQDHVLNIPLQSMVDQTDAGMAKEALGRMMSTECQEPANIVLRKATAVRSRSHIAGVDTIVVPGQSAEGPGAPSLRTTGQTNCGGTAGEEEDDLHQSESPLVLLSSQLVASKTLAVELSQESTVVTQ